MFFNLKRGRKTLQPEEFIRQVGLLTGSEVKGHDQIDRESLAAILRDDATPLDCSHLDGLLLLVHKDRVEPPFFNYFFGKACTVGRLPDCVASFQKAALLLYGNFVFAYRTLSGIKERREFAEKTAAIGRNPKSELLRFQKRQKKLLEIDRISWELTPFVGYLSVRDIPVDLRSCVSTTVLILARVAILPISSGVR